MSFVFKWLYYTSTFEWGGGGHGRGYRLGRQASSQAFENYICSKFLNAQTERRDSFNHVYRDVRC